MIEPADIEGLATGAYIQAAQRAARPERRRSLSEWAAEEMRLSPESSALPGPFHPYPYQVAMLDSITDPTVERVTIIKSARTGGTAVIKAAMAYHIAEVPAPMLYVLPNVGDAERFSTEELAPMLRDVPALRDRVADPRSRDSGNKILKKNFLGGSITLVGGNSARGFRGSTIRILFMDDLDGLAKTAGIEGDQEELAEKRTETFHNRKIVKNSTPSTKGISRIERSWEESDQRLFYVPCPECGAMQDLKFGNFKWDKDAAGNGLPETTFYVCDANSCIIQPRKKRWMVNHGEWVITKPGDGKHVGYRIWTAYSFAPHTGWVDIVRKFLKAKKNGVETLKTFINTTLGESWEGEHGEGANPQRLYDRREEFDARETLPLGALVITSATDVQDNRLETELKAWGIGEESWSVDHIVTWGDPGGSAPWEALDKILLQRFTRPDGIELGIACSTIDSGGHHSGAVYDFVRGKAARRVWAIKGASAVGKPIVSRPSTRNKGKVPLVLVGTDAAKAYIFSRYRLEAAGPGYLHFPKRYPEELFQQLTAERAILKYRRGFPYRQWEVFPAGRPNEMLDLQVYNLAALRLLNANLKRLQKGIEKQAEDLAATAVSPAPPDPDEKAPLKKKVKRKPAKRRPRRGSGGGWADPHRRGGKKP